MIALSRDPALDGLRGIAVGMILLLHGFAFAPGGLVTTALHEFTQALYVGVDLFFVLSGFLITSILLRSRAASGYFRNFYARRVLRIFPAYYLVLAACYALRPLAGEPALQAQMDHDAVYYMLYVQNVVMAWRGHAGAWIGLDPTWSLAIEEQFYLAWPALILLVPRSSLPRLCLALGIASTAARALMNHNGVTMWSQYVTTVSHAEGLCFGAALAAYRDSGDRIAPRWLRPAGFIALVYFIAWHPAWAEQSVLHPLIVAILFSWILAETVGSGPDAPLRRFLQTTPLTRLGRYSYGIYLIHYPVLTLIGARSWIAWKDAYGVNLAVLMSGLLMSAITLVLAVAMYQGVEAPLLRLKRHFTQPGLEPLRDPVA